MRGTFEELSEAAHFAGAASPEQIAEYERLSIERNKHHEAMMGERDYLEFLDRKTQLGGDHGFEPTFMPDFLFDYQKHLVEWSLRKGRAAIFADCGLGKTPMQLVWAENVSRKLNGKVLILTPLAVGAQTVAQGEQFGIACGRSRGGESVSERIVVSNYEQLHYFDPQDYVGVVCDESSILKHFSGRTQKEVTRFMSKVPCRLLCTATAAPNDFFELGTSSEALGDLGHSDMLARFFKQSDKQAHRMQKIKDEGGKFYSKDGKRDMHDHNYFGKLAFRAAQQIGLWKLKGHAEVPFWRWVASWARACRKPSDLGFDDGALILPPLTENHHIIPVTKPRSGMLFAMEAFGLAEEREERKLTLHERCEFARDLAGSNEQAILWVQYNPEGDLLEKMIPDCVQVSGSDSERDKEDRLVAFMRGDVRVLVTKSKIAGFGLNMQNCHRVVTFATHSYESYYQSIRRCWRFGQKHPVTVDIIATEGEKRISDNMARKAKLMTIMFDRMIEHMHAAVKVDQRKFNKKLEVPSWLSNSK